MQSLLSAQSTVFFNLCQNDPTRRNQYRVRETNACSQSKLNPHNIATEAKTRKPLCRKAAGRCTGMVRVSRRASLATCSHILTKYLSPTLPQARALTAFGCRLAHGRNWLRCILSVQKSARQEDKKVPAFLCWTLKHVQKLLSNEDRHA